MKHIQLSLSIFLATIVGIIIGIGSYTFIYAKGYSYMTDNPAACDNCHVMEGHFSGWMKGSHRSVATCNDCHTPPGLINKYLTKASNGFWHSFAFTTDLFPDQIQIKQGNLEITDGACIKCHEEITETIGGGHSTSDKSKSCIPCHRSVGHME
ncbi:MAG: cytochrome c nitrite reductase small subunit [Ignavibacteriales bacterium]|nr:cytochrome c nitrite reductase small subunit [Ignavibacteriales bacterium]